MENSTTYVLGWTLVHFVWQGGVVAALLAGTNALLGRDAAQGRYWAACVALLFLLLAPVVTYGYLDVLLPAYEGGTALAGNVAETVGPGRGAVITPLRGPGETGDLSGLLAADPFLPWLVWGWLAGALVLGGRMLSGWLGLQWIRKAADPVSGLWCQRCDVLRRSLYIRRSVRLLESAKVAVPLTMGWIRPVVLVPVGFLSGLPVAQVEAILLHELAHIRRYDYLVNLVQSLAEVVLFYHPAVWWVSRCLRREREFCCDALVARRSRDGAEYGRSLLALEEWVQGAGRALAPAATDGVLLERVRRLVGVVPPRASIDIRRVLLVGPLLLLLGASLVAMGERAKEYEAHTVLLYKAEQRQEERGKSATLEGQLAMVLVETNLEEVRQRLLLDASTEEIREAFKAEIQPGTDMLRISVRWDDATKTAELANTLREVFINNQRVIRRSLIGIKVRDFEEKLEGVKREYQIAASHLEKFKVDNAGRSYQDLQNHKLQLIGALERLRQLVEIETEYLEEGVIDLGQFVGDLHRGFERLPASRDVDNFLSVHQIRLQILSKALETGKQDAAAFKEPIMEAAAKLHSAVIDEKERLQAVVTEIPRLQAEYEELSSTAAFWMGQRRELEQQLAVTRRDYQSNLSEFTLMREAQVPRVPID